MKTNRKPASRRSRTILIIEDAVALAHGLAMNFEHDGIAAVAVHTGGKAMEWLATNTPSAILLDILLPDMNGLAVMQAVREKHPEIPIIVLSALTSELDKRVAFRLGATAYLTKPFDLMQLLGIVNQAITSNGARIEISKPTHTVRVDGRVVYFTPKEFELLALLVEANGQVISKQQLLDTIWKVPVGVRTTTVESHLKTLRTKLKPFGLDHAIVTLPKIGFKWAPVDETVGGGSHNNLSSK